MYDPIREQFYTTNELAEILSIKPQTLTAHARSGRLPACQPYSKGPWMFPKDEVAAYLRKRVNHYSNSMIRPLRARQSELKNQL
jgi:excisionase family DNA binding protein